MILLLSTEIVSAVAWQSGNNIYIDARQNLTEVYNDIANVTALSYDGSGNCLLNANLINNVTTNRFYMNNSDTLCYSSLRINSTHADGIIYWYYLTNGQTEINNYTIVAWNSTSGTDESLSVSTWQRSYVYVTGASSKLNISNSNLSNLGYSTTDRWGVTYISTSGNIVTNTSFLSNYRIHLESTNSNIFTNNTATSDLSNGIYLRTCTNNLFIDGGYIITDSGGYDYYIRNSYTNNIFNNTNFSIPRSILLYDNLTVFSHDFYRTGVLVNTTLVVSPTTLKSTTRNLINGNVTNTSWSETWDIAGVVRYNLTGLLTNTQYVVYNDTSIDRYLTTDANGVLPSFTINFTTALKTVKVLQHSDTTLPTYSSAGHNATLINHSTLFYINYDDTVALNSNGQWIFATNNTGIWVNDSAINWTATPQWANVTKTLNATAGITVGYRWYANDNDGNWNNTSIYTLTTTASPNITSWGNNYTNSDLLDIVIELFSPTLFNATADQSIVWSWFLNGTNQSHNYDNFSYYFDQRGYKTIEVNGSNDNGLSNTVQWNCTVKQSPEINVSMVIT